MLNQQIIKANNLKRLYLLIGANENMSRAGLAARTQLSKPTVSALVDELIETGYVIDSGVGTSDRAGRKPNTLEINCDNCIAVFSWHRSYVLAALIDAQYAPLAVEKLSLPERPDYVAATETALEKLRNIAGERRRILGICVVVPSMIDDTRRKIISTVLDIDTDDDVLARLQQALNAYPVTVLNDTACYAYAEYAGQTMETSSFVFVNMGRGVGAVLLDGGVMFRGAGGMTTQFGHLSIDRHGAPCNCGSRGCLETMVGEMALAQRAEEHGVEDLFAQSKHFTFERLGQLARENNPKALKLLRLLADDLAYGLGNLISLMHPQLIVIGGSGVALGKLFLDAVAAGLHTTGYPLFTADVALRFSQLDKQSELQGAARYYIDKHFSFLGEVRETLFIG